MKVRRDVIDGILNTEYEARGDGSKKPKDGKVVETHQPDDGNVRLVVPLGVLVKFKEGQKRS